MSRKLNQIPFINSYADIRAEMNDDLSYRLATRTDKTSIGRPLYYRINVQLITTEECPFNCPFCLERQNPMTGDNNFQSQIEALKSVLQEHPDARLTITGGEPGLYPKHVENIVNTFRQNSNGVFCSINTAGYSTELNSLAHINLSYNDFVRVNPAKFPNCTVQTVMETPTISFYRKEESMVDYKKFYEYFKDLYGTGLEVANWHLNGNTEPFDSFFDSAIEFASKSANPKDLWFEFGDVPMNPETECIEEAWHHFPAGTPREDIWHWFEETFDIRVYDLMYE